MKRLLFIVILLTLVWGLSRKETPAPVIEETVAKAPVQVPQARPVTVEKAEPKPSARAAVVDKKPVEVPAAIALAAELLRSKKPEQAIAPLEKYLTEKMDPEAKSMLGVAYLQSGDTVNAKRTFLEVTSYWENEVQQIIESDEDPSEAAQKATWSRLDLAQAHLQDGQKEEANALVDQSLKELPQDPHARAMKLAITNPGT